MCVGADEIILQKETKNLQMNAAKWRNNVCLTYNINMVSNLFKRGIELSFPAPPSHPAVTRPETDAVTSKAEVTDTHLLASLQEEFHA